MRTPKTSGLCSFLYCLIILLLQMHSPCKVQSNSVMFWHQHKSWSSFVCRVAREACPRFLTSIVRSQESHLKQCVSKGFSILSSLIGSVRCPFAGMFHSLIGQPGPHEEMSKRQPEQGKKVKWKAMQVRRQWVPLGWSAAEQATGSPFYINIYLSLGISANNRWWETCTQVKGKGL